MDEKVEQAAQSKKFLTAPQVGLGLGVFGTGVWSFIDSETLKSFISSAWREDIVRMAIAFTAAGIVHRFIFRRDMEKYFLKIVNPIVDAINNVADRTGAMDTKIVALDSKVTDQGKVQADHSQRLVLIEQHLTPRQT